MGFILAPLMRSMRFTNPAGSWGIWATPSGYIEATVKTGGSWHRGKLRKYASNNRYLQVKYSWTRLGIVGRRCAYSRLGRRLLVRPLVLFFLFGRHIFWRSRAASRCALFLSSFALCYICRFDRKGVPQELFMTRDDSVAHDVSHHITCNISSIRSESIPINGVASLSSSMWITCGWRNGWQGPRPIEIAEVENTRIVIDMTRAILKKIVSTCPNSLTKLSTSFLKCGI